MDNRTRPIHFRAAGTPSTNVAHPDNYYSRHQATHTATHRARTGSQSQTDAVGRPHMVEMDKKKKRRMSHDIPSQHPRRFIVDVDETLRIVLHQEDTDGDFQISITDSGPKVVTLGTASSNGVKTFDVRGNYMLSNLIQELATARDHGRTRIILDEERLSEPPVDRLSRMIATSFWRSLTRRIDGDGLEIICADPKNRTGHLRPRIYVPYSEERMYQYYKKVADDRKHLKLEVIKLPEHGVDDPAFVKSLNDQPGLLALAMEDVDNGAGGKTLRGIPFIVPGARFNELYNWDSYFISLGLLVDGHIDMAKGMVEHFIFQIRHYKKILNGSRSYYLCRTQPPFLTDMTLQIYNQLSKDTPESLAFANDWLRRAICAAIKEYHTIWMVPPRLDPVTGLSRYHPDGLGIPPETEASHFTHILEPYAHKHGISILEFTQGYNDGTIKEPELDEYFVHDRAVRESGHDTTYRFEKKCAHLATIDLNALLYKYEVDIATAIQTLGAELSLEEDFALSPFPPTAESVFGDQPAVERSLSRVQTVDEWLARKDWREGRINKYLWNEGKKLYFDWDTVSNVQMPYESVTAFWALWAGCASEQQAFDVMSEGMRKFEVIGGLVSGTEESRGRVSLDRPNRQWDFPYAWPPHQIVAWVGLERYGRLEDAQRLAYRWLYMMTTAFVDFNGVVPEKFDAVKLSHMVDAEYGNQGVDFKMIPREGFGWMNAAYQVGLTFITESMRRALNSCVSPEKYFAKDRVNEAVQVPVPAESYDPLDLALEAIMG